MRIKLVVTPARSGPPSEFVFDQDSITIGRDLAVHLPLSDEQRVVSKRHAEIRCNGTLTHLVDLGSTNLTYLNGCCLQPGQPYELNTGDAFRIGGFEIRFSRMDDTRPTMPEPAPPPAEPGYAGAPSLSDQLRTFYAPPGASERQDAALFRRAVEELSMLNEFASDIGAARDANEVIARIIRRSLQAVHAEQGVITLPDDEPQEEEAPAPDPVRTLMRLTSSSAVHAPLRPDRRLMEWMQLHKQPLLLNHPRQDERFRSAAWEAGIHSLLCVPLIVRSRLTAILTVYNKKGGTGFTTDDQRLLTIIAAQSAQIIENARLHEEEQKLLQMREEMRLAHQIQIDLLPKQAPVLPGYELAGRSLPAQTVGGDFFDYIPIDAERLGVCVGDVSGKGLPASLVMANAQATLRGQAPWVGSVAECLARANRLLYESTNRSTFVSLFYGVLDARHHLLRYSNAGHNRPLLLKGDGTLVRLHEGGLVLGALRNQSYREASVPLGPGDVLLVYSDGITEARDRQGEEFGEERLARVLRERGHEPAAALVGHVLRAVERFTHGCAQIDDITLLVARRTA